MPRRLLVVAGLVLGLLGMHGLAPGYPAAGARELPTPAATASATPMAAGHGTPAPADHHEPVLSHDLCTAVLTGGVNAAGGAGAVGHAGPVEPFDRLAPRSAYGTPIEPRPPDLFALGVLRI
jgi:hypothetical protein